MKILFPLVVIFLLTACGAPKLLTLKPVESEEKLYWSDGNAYFTQESENIKVSACFKQADYREVSFTVWIENKDTASFTVFPNDFRLETAYDSASFYYNRSLLRPDSIVQHDQRQIEQNAQDRRRNNTGALVESTAMLVGSIAAIATKETPQQAEKRLLENAAINDSRASRTQALNDKGHQLAQTANFHRETLLQANTLNAYEQVGGELKFNREKDGQFYRLTLVIDHQFFVFLFKNSSYKPD